MFRSVEQSWWWLYWDAKIRQLSYGIRYRLVQQKLEMVDTWIGLSQRFQLPETDSLSWERENRFLKRKKTRRGLLEKYNFWEKGTGSTKYVWILWGEDWGGGNVYLKFKNTLSYNFSNIFILFLIIITKGTVLWKKRVLGKILPTGSCDKGTGSK